MWREGHKREIDAEILQNKRHAAALSCIHISEPTRLRRNSYAVSCLKKKKTKKETMRDSCHPVGDFTPASERPGICTK